MYLALIYVVFYLDKVRLASIHEAVRFGDVLELQAMVQRGAGINTLDNKFKFTPLHWAALHGTLEVNTELFSDNLNPKLF